MKTKTILSALFGLLVSAVISVSVASATDNPVAGAGILSLGILSMFLSPVLNIGGVALALINPAQITWNGKEVMSMTEAIMETVYSQQELNSVHAIVEGIVAKQQIAFLGTLSKITKKKTSCGGSAGSHSLTMSEKFWEPVQTKFWLEECADTLNESFWVWGRNKGVKKYDLTDTDFAEFIMERITSALNEDVWRIVWFNDTAHANVDDSPAGVITSGVSLTDYNLIDGLWSQIYDIVSSNSDRRVTFSKNSQGSYANQAFNSTDTTNKVAIGYLQSLVDNADDRLKERTDAFILVTGSIYDQYKRELKSYTALESSFSMLQNGVKVLTFDGIPLIPMRQWDRTIKSDFDNGTTYYQPHRAVYTVKENIPVGFDDSNAVTAMENFYLPKEETNNWKGFYQIDAKVLEDYMIQVGY